MKKYFSVNHLCLYILLSLASVLFFYYLGDPYLTNWDEAWYADMSLSIAKSFNFLTLYWNGEPFFDKPPLYMWISALFMTVIPDLEFAARFPSALSGLGTIIGVYHLGKLLGNNRAGVLSSLVIVSTIGFLYRARTGNLDVLTSFWILLSILSLLNLYKRQSHLWGGVLGISLALGYLTKGIVIFIFPSIYLALLLLIQKRKLFNFDIWLGMFLGIIIAGCWLAVSYLINGQIFWNQFLANQTGKINNQTSFLQNFSFDYFYFLKSGLKLWLIPIIPAATYMLWKFKFAKDLPVLSLWLFVIFYLTLLTFSENKSNWFLIPLYPVLAVTIGLFLSQIISVLTYKLQMLLLALLILISVFEISYYQDQYLVADVSGDEARVALAAKQMTSQESELYLTDHYYPTTAFYSQRKVYAVFGQFNKTDTWWIKNQGDWGKILSFGEVYIIGSTEALKRLEKNYPNYHYEILFSSGNRQLVKKTSS